MMSTCSPEPTKRRSRRSASASPFWRGFRTTWPFFARTCCTRRRSVWQENNLLFQPDRVAVLIFRLDFTDDSGLYARREQCLKTGVSAVRRQAQQKPAGRLGVNQKGRFRSSGKAAQRAPIFGRGGALDT